VHLTERAHEIGVDGFLVVTPYYNKPPQRGIVAHTAAIAAVTNRPIVFYDIPSRVVVDAEPATISALAEIANVRAVKQSKPSLEAARHVVACGLDLYAGDDDLTLPFLEVGGVGVISVIGHIVGSRLKELIGCFRAGDLEGARALDEELRPAIDLLRVQTNPIAIKTALNLLGHDVGGFACSSTPRSTRRPPCGPLERQACRSGPRSNLTQPRRRAVASVHCATMIDRQQGHVR
jgi:4-hydroxy-tetrahydrodipicolinate synthase